MLLKILKAIVFRPRYFSLKDWKEIANAIENSSRNEIEETLKSVVKNLEIITRELDEQVIKIERLQALIEQRLVDPQDKEVSDQIKGYQQKIVLSKVKLDAYQSKFHYLSSHKQTIQKA